MSRPFKNRLIPTIILIALAIFAVPIPVTSTTTPTTTPQTLKNTILDTKDLEQAISILPQPAREIDPILEVRKEVIEVASTLKVDVDLALAIIKCESKFNPNAIGHLAVVGNDYGLLQVNSYYHKITMIKLGLNIYNWHDSLTYGLMMMKNQGTGAWSASHNCWSYAQKILIE